ncbi:hypothetical protein NicSoilB4_21670 [Arthrobacter sp. NicSoilB4]|uniref:LapA family protein n=1 Tax=Arthrobacter sp. NicSoilB4 TaxID=2830997 RepID=UPI001CC79967|nr:lipopolysaccharide assembly protein LapA domain-containing protein [Arthrobacter sp. NicSoilB4]BCW67404.1 hypothetical protein NicSoilB4_21670 [Arthrobacter sp. NicSoilB4]
MTQTPRGFDPHDSKDALSSQHPGAADAPSAEEGHNTRPPSDGTDLVSGAPADSPSAQRVETPREGAPAAETRQVTRAGMVWVAVASALVVLILLIAFILQNQEYVQVKFFGLQGSVPLGIALFIAAVGGGVLVAIAGAARIIQLRLAAHRARVSRQAGQGTRRR